MVDGLVLKDGFDAMDFRKITEMLAEVHWCMGTKIEEVTKGAENSALLVGAFLPDGTQIGYARAISDKTRFAYILDVVVDKAWRKQGIGQAMMKYLMAHESLSDVYQWLLITKDAHGVYRKLGFDVITRPLDWMEIKHPRPPR